MNDYSEQWEKANQIGAKRFIATGYHYSDDWYNLSGIVNTGRVLSLLEKHCFNDHHVPIGAHNFLEIGCGNGRMTRYFSDVFSRIVAVDCSKTVIDLAKKNAPSKNVEWIVNDGETLKEVSSDSMDIVFSYIVFQHMKKETILGYLAEVSRVIKKGGIFIFQLPVKMIDGDVQDPGEFNHVSKWPFSIFMREMDKLGFVVEMNASSALDYHIFQKV